MPALALASVGSTARVARPAPEVAAEDRRWVPLALALVYVVWGSTYLAMRVAVAAIPPYLMAGTRFVAVGVLLFAVLWARGAPWPRWREWGGALVVALFMFVVGNGAVSYAEQRISSGIAALVCGTMPAWTAALGRFFGEKTSLREWAGLLLGIGGVVVLSLGFDLRAELVPALVLSAAPVAWALGSLLSRRMPLAPGLMSPATQMLQGGAVMVAVGLARGERWPEHVPLDAWLAWGYLAVFGSLVAYSAYAYLLRTTRAAVATSYSYVNPPIAVLLGALVAGEAIGPETVASILLVGGATALVLWRPKAAPQAA